MTALLFPGQGTQSVGMGGAMAAAFAEETEAVLDAAERIVPGLALLLRRGPAERLAQTENAQPAVTAVDLCALAVLRSRDVAFDVVAGHSVGLLSALVAADVLDVEDAIALAARRGALMGALPAGGAMTSVAGLVPAAAEALARSAALETELPVVVALVNAPETVVFSGAEQAVDRAAEFAVAKGARVSRLAVSHAFHSPLMEPAFAEWRRIVDSQPLRDAAVPVVSDLSGEPLVAAGDLRDLLAVQLVTPVRWDRVGDYLQRSGAHECVEVGDSKVLRSLAREFPELQVASMALPETLVRLRRERAVVSA